MLPDQEMTVALWQALLEGGLYVNMARPPATPAGTYLLRCSLCAEHSDEQVGQILGHLRACGTRGGLHRLKRFRRAGGTAIMSAR
jgi:8-amino-7-oxononanoate synthase